VTQALSRPSIDQLRLLPDDARVELLARRREDQWFDRTSARVQPRALADVMMAFANAEGGLIAIGIHDGRIEGVAGAQERQNQWRKAARDFADPPILARFELIPCVNSLGQPDQLILIEVEASEHVHENVKGEVHLRIGDDDRRLTGLEAQELRYDKGGTFFDGTPVMGTTVEDLDDGLVGAFLRPLGSPARTTDALVSRGLLSHGKRGLVPTVAGILTLSREPQRWFPEARVRLLRFAGRTSETGARANALRDVWVGGPLREQILTTRRHVRRWLGTAVRLGADGRFRPTSLIPEGAWLEAVVNAVIHRSYSLGGDHVRVSLFSDRLEVESPGRLPGLVRIETIRSTRFARNPRIARAILELGFGRELGEGVDRMFEEMQLAGLPDPAYRQGPASVTVALLMDPLGARLLRLLPAGSGRLVDYLLAKRRITTAEASEVLGVAVNTARRYLTVLADAGHLVAVRKSARDPHGYWALVDEGP
jgi:ATP-dependent DNA helicase RecG